MPLALEHLEPRLLLDGASLFGEFASEGALVSLYDVGSGGLTADAVQVGFGPGGGLPCGIGADSIGSIKLSDLLDYLLVFLGDIL